MSSKKYPVRIKAPQPAQVEHPDGKRELRTYIQDWMTLEEFESMKPGCDIVRYMSYEAVGPEHWTIHVTPDEVLNCERDRAIQGIYINAVLRKFLSQAEKEPDEIRKVTKGYDEIGPDAVLFLMQLHEMLNQPVDAFESPTLEDETIIEAVSMMVQKEVTLHDLMKSEETPPQG